MVELIVMGIVVVLFVLGVLYALPRYLADPESGDGFLAREEDWPNVLARLENFARDWTEKPRTWDIGLAAITILLLAAAVFLHQDPSALAGLEEYAEFVVHTLGILGFVGLFAASYLNVRRAGLHGAEASLIGMTLVGTVLMILVVVLLLQ